MSMKRFTLMMMAVVVTVLSYAQTPTQRMLMKPAKKAAFRKAAVRRAAAEATFNFNAMDVATSSNDATDGDITEAVTLTEGDVTLTVSPKTEEATTENRFWGTKNGPQLRVYSGTLTFEATGEEPITKLAFSAARWNEGNSADAGELAEAVWTGSAQKVVVTIAGNTQLNSVVCTLGGEVAPEVELVTLPEGVEPVEYTLTAEGAAYGQSGWQALSVESTVQVAIDGNDVYLSGLAYFFPENYVKGTLDGDKLTVPSGQFIGEDEYGKEYLIGFVAGETEDDPDVITDYVFNYDAATKTFTLADGYYIGESESPTEEALYTYLTSATFTEGGIVLPDVVELPAGAEVETWYLSARNYDGNKVEQEMGVAFVGSDVYLQGMCSYLPEAWVKGTVDGATATFAAGQYYGQYAGQYNLFFGAYDQSGVLADVVFEYDAETGTFTTDDYILLNGKESAVSFYDYYSNVVITREQAEPLVAIEAPANLQTEEYSFVATELDYQEADEEAGTEAGYVDSDFANAVQIGFDGQDVYIKGLAPDYADGWAKGTLSDDGKTVTIPANQYLGTEEISFFGSVYTYDYFFTAADPETGELVDVVLNYDAENNVLTTDQHVFINSARNELLYYNYFVNVVITKKNDVAAVPANPTVTGFSYNVNYGYGPVRFDIPTVGTEGEELLTSKLSYQLLIEKDGVVEPLTLTPALYVYLTEDMTEIPYTFTDNYDIYNDIVYLNQPLEELQTWTKIGVQSIYRGGDAENKSEIGWFDLVDYWASVGINDINADLNSGKAVIFNLAGQRLAQPQKGLNIINGRKVVIK